MENSDLPDGIVAGWNVSDFPAPLALTVDEDNIVFSQDKIIFPAGVTRVHIAKIHLLLVFAKWPMREATRESFFDGANRDIAANNYKKEFYEQIYKKELIAIGLYGKIPHDAGYPEIDQAYLTMKTFVAYADVLGVTVQTAEATSSAPTAQAAPAIEPVTTAKPHVHKSRRRASSQMTAEISQAKNTAVDPDDFKSVWVELMKLAETKGGYGAIICSVPEGISYRGRRYQESQEPDVFTKRSLRERMKRKMLQSV